jgi:DNA (cytosine-5)-methyltransferase 1
MADHKLKRNHNVDTSKELSTNGPLNVISFCSGYGGIERGLDLTGTTHRVLAYVEIEAFAVANLASKMESGELDAAPIYTDIKTFPAHLFRGCVDLITGGYPCQPFSAAGRRRGEDDPRHLWPYIREHINAIEPVQCFFENVEGHISLGLSSVISDLEEDGYDSTWGIFSASEVGAPHQRKRVYILANTGIPFGDDSETDSQCADTDSVRPHREEEHRCRSVQRGIKLQHQQERESRQVREDVADTVSQGFQERQSHSRILGKGRKPPARKDFELEGNQRNTSLTWPVEPNVGRVVDGCADRVDRIRMLGNGVVPQTAAKAWRTLNER